MCKKYFLSGLVMLFVFIFVTACGGKQLTTDDVAIMLNEQNTGCEEPEDLIISEDEFIVTITDILRDRFIVKRPIVEENVIVFIVSADGIGEQVNSKGYKDSAEYDKLIEANNMMCEAIANAANTDRLTKKIYLIMVDDVNTKTPLIISDKNGQVDLNSL